MRIYGIYNDSRQGVLWVGTDGQGAIMYSKKYSIATNLMLNSFSPNLTRQVRSIMTDKYGGLLVWNKGRRAAACEKLSGRGTRIQHRGLLAG